MSIKQISVFVENKPGTMKAMTDVLAARNIDIRALSLAETKDFGIVRVITDKVYDAVTALKDEGFIHKITPVLGVAVPDEPGGLTKMLGALTDAGVNLEYMYEFTSKNKSGSAYMILRVADEGAAAAALKASGICVVGQEELAKI